LDARLLNGGGIGRYIREISRRWLVEPEVGEVRFLGARRELERWLLDRAGAEKARVVPWDDPIYSIRAQARWVQRGRIWSRGCHVCLFPHWDAPAAAIGPPRVVTVHDLTHFLEPGGFPAWKRVPGRLLLGRVVRTAAAVITVSEASGRDLEAYLPGTAARVRVIPNGVPHDVFRPLEEGERAEADDVWGRLQPYLLFVGPFKPHKGGVTALRVLLGLLGSHPGLRLVQAGPSEVRDPEAQRLLADPALRSRVVQAGVLEDRRLNQLYALSECVLHPALREGFGLPPVEAMAAGTPVIASDRSSLPEVVGPGGRLLDPLDAEAWIRAVREILEEDGVRESWVRRGTERARSFSWDRTAKETLNVLREIGSPSDRAAREGTPGRLA
jgi:glycosyltransferase involved in cell wall biosynthesis